MHGITGGSMADASKWRYFFQTRISVALSWFSVCHDMLMVPEISKTSG